VHGGCRGGDCAGAPYSTDRTLDEAAHRERRPGNHPDCDRMVLAAAHASVKYPDADAPFLV
jgi:hypothetical protein